jgi:hypothetical protein
LENLRKTLGAENDPQKMPKRLNNLSPMLIILLTVKMNSEMDPFSLQMRKQPLPKS